MNQRGQALVETVLVSLVLLVPLVWMLMVLSNLHRAALASTAAVREAGFDAARSADLESAGRAVDRAVATALANHGLDIERARVRWSSSNALERGAVIEVSVRYSVPAFHAPFLGDVAGPSISINARHTARVDPFRSRS